MGKRICVLEDDDDIREVIEMLLNEEAYEVTGFASVSDFVKGGKGLMPDLFLLDVMLPDGNGIDVCEMLKSGEHTAYIPILMMSAHSTDELVKESCRADGFVAKPFDIDELIRKVSQAMSIN
ncbi:response regulator transcription factor [Pedobacter frigidisoli]|uniref:response regulator transcription factor n=1 Tax=Pedobacter frigidisoli TaxID=2530455 RepID=UPI00293181B9|nr:response regulator [Pedobacter frigidisoli]